MAYITLIIGNSPIIFGKNRIKIKFHLYIMPFFYIPEI